MALGTPLSAGTLRSCEQGIFTELVVSELPVLHDAVLGM